MRPNRSSACACVALGAASLILAGCLGSPEDEGGAGEALEASSGAVMARPIGDIEATYDPTANLPPFVQCDSFTDELDVDYRLKHTTTAICTRDYVTVNTYIFFKVTASFPDLASSPSACSAAHLDMRLYDLGGAVPKRFQTETIPAKIVGSKCLATAEYGYHDYLDTPRFEIALGTTPGNANNKLTTSLWNWDVTPP